MIGPAASERILRRIALVGNPNSGKTTLFNALTGLRQKVGNYPGVTVERKEGALIVGGKSVAVVDLPGLYSLTPHSPDERIARDVLLGYQPGEERPDAILNVVDASNLERNLYLTSQLADLGTPMIVVVTMSDTAARRGIVVDAAALSAELGVTAVCVVASRREGFAELNNALELLTKTLPPPRRWELPSVVETEAEELATLLAQHHQLAPEIAFAEAVALLGVPSGALQTAQIERWSPLIREHLKGDLVRLASAGHDPATAVAEARYADIGRIVSRAVQIAAAPPVTTTERLDRVFLHRFWGYVIFVGLMLLLFQMMFTWAEIPKGWIEAGISWLGEQIQSHMAAGTLRDLIVAAVLGGVGTTLTFLPQILLMFLFLSILEDTGYLARAAFLMDRLMSRVGLHGKSFIPLLSSYACAIPGVMATRTIESSKARLLTILIAPLMSCSARIPVYTVMIGAFIPNVLVAGFHLGALRIGLTLPALTLFAMYALGTLAAFGMAWVFNKTILKSEPLSFLLELPPYRKPELRTVVVRMGEQAWQFVQRAGSVILPISIVLWFLTENPKAPVGTPPAVAQEQSYAGKLGKAMEPVIAPLGFDWKMGIGLISSFAAREVFVSTMATIYNVGDDGDEDTKLVSLQERMRSDKKRDGTPVFTPLVAVSLMVYYVLAMQCMSTIAVVRRETNSWRWPLFQVAYMTALAYVASLLVYQGGLWIFRH